MLIRRRWLIIKLIIVSGFGHLAHGCKSKQPINVEEELRKMILGELSISDRMRNVHLNDYTVEVGDPGLVGSSIRVKTTVGRARGLQDVHSEETTFDKDKAYLTVKAVVDNIDFDTTVFVRNPTTREDTAAQVKITGALRFTLEVWFNMDTETVKQLTMGPLVLTYKDYTIRSMQKENSSFFERPSFEDGVAEIFEKHFLQKELGPIVDDLLRSRKYTLPKQ